MLWALTATALATDPVYVQVVETPTGFVLVDEFRDEVSPDVFAKAVGDERTRRAHHVAYMRVKGASWVLWGGGIGCGVSGLTMVMMTPLADDPPVVGLAGAGFVAVGVASVFAGAQTYAVGRRGLDDPTRWYTLESAQTWAENQ